MMIFQTSGIQIFSVMYLLLILIVYSSKKRFKSVENNIFKVLLIFTLFELIVDIAINYSIKYSDIIPIINSFLCKLSLFNNLIWASLLMLYVFLIDNKEHYKSLKELYQNSFKIQVLTIISFLLAFVVFLLPLNFVYDEYYKISYITGISSTYTYFIAIIYLIIILITVLTNKNKVSFSKRIPIFIFIISSAIFLPIQKFNEDVPVLTVSLMAFAIMIMYFTLENPDVKLIDELNELKLKAEEASKIKTKFLDNVSYNMKLPMNAILGYSQMILTEKNLSYVIKDDAQKINKACNQLLEMVDNTLDISRVESGLYKVSNEEYDLKELLQSISFIALDYIDKDKVKFTMDVDSNIPRNLIGDYDKLFKVLSNIVSNSVKYTNVGKIIFSVYGKVVDNNLNLTFKIKDTGIGIKEKDKDRIFEKFDRIENVDTEGNQGTGLGLSLSKKVIELLGGNINFESTYGVGSTFIINISQKIGSNEPIGIFAVNTYKNNINSFDCSNYRALIIDENKYCIQVLERMLGLYGINCDGVIKMEEYVDLLKNENKYDIVFIDDKSSAQNIFKILQTYKNISNKDLKVIALSEDSLDVSKSYYINKGYDDYLIKPVNLLKIDKLLNKFYKDKK